MKATPFLRSAGFDLGFFAAPGLISVAIALTVAGFWPAQLKTSLASWLVLVLLCDVAHVYATLYRVYLKPAEVQRRRLLYLVTPIAVFAIGFAVYLGSASAFWRVMAYLAVFHFVKQQVGFVALYRAAARERDRLTRLIDTVAIYAGTLVPILFWHTTLPREFHWFVDGDFITGLPREIMWIAWPLYGAALAAYVSRRAYIALTTKKWNIGKDSVMVATWVSWYVGIVALNFDFTFTVTNVLLHGVAYMALVWHVEGGGSPGNPPLKRWAPGRVVVFLTLLFALAFAEEFLWDGFVWQEKPMLFSSLFYGLIQHETAVAGVVALLAVPQTTHYVLDGFIWRLDGSNPGLDRRLFDLTQR